MKLSIRVPAVLALICLLLGTLAVSSCLSGENTVVPPTKTTLSPAASIAQVPSIISPVASGTDTQEPPEISIDRDNILYQDDFSDTASGWSTEASDSGDLYYETGEYSLLNLKTDSYAYSLVPLKTVSDFAFEVDYRVISKESKGFLTFGFRLQDNKNFYVFSLSDNAFRLYKCVQGQATILQEWQNSGDIFSPPNTNKLKVVCLGSQIDLYDNGKRLGSYNDSSVASGRLYMSAIGANTHVHFDNLKVYAIKDSSAATSTAIMNAAINNYDQAVQYRDSGDNTTALEYYEKAIRGYAMYASAWYDKGEILAGLGQYAEALKCFQNTTAIDPKATRAWIWEGQCLEALGNRNAAMSCYNQALELETENSQAMAAKEKLIDSGIPDNTDNPPDKEYDTAHPLTVTGPVMTITVNEGKTFSTTLTVADGQAPYTWFLVQDNGIAQIFRLSLNETGDTLTISGTANFIDDSATVSRYAFIEVRAEDSSQVTRKGEGSFQLHVINSADTPSTTPSVVAGEIITSTAAASEQGSNYDNTLSGNWQGTFHILSTTGIAGGEDYRSQEVTCSISMRLWQKGSNLEGRFILSDIQRKTLYDYELFSSDMIVPDWDINIAGTVNSDGSITFTDFWGYSPFNASAGVNSISADFEKTYTSDASDIICLKFPGKESENVMANVETTTNMRFNLQKTGD